MEIKKYPFIVLSREAGTDIVFVEYPTKLKVDLAMAKEIVASRLDFTTDSHYTIIDLSGIRKITREANKYMQHPEGGAKNILAGAFIASNPVSALLANVFVKAPKSVLTKYFSNKEDALNWIKELKQKAAI